MKRADYLKESYDKEGKQEGWMVKAIYDHLTADDESSISPLYEETVEDFAQYMRDLPMEQIEDLVDNRIGDLQSLLTQIRLYQNFMIDLGRKFEDITPFFEDLASSLLSRIYDVEDWINAIDPLLAIQSMEQKQIYIWMIGRVETPLEEGITEFEKALDKVRSYGMLNFKKLPKLETKMGHLLTDLREGARKILNALVTLKTELSDFYNIMDKL